MKKLIFLLGLCVMATTHTVLAQSITDSVVYQWADPYRDAIFGQQCADTVTFGWPANVNCQVYVNGNLIGTYPGGAIWTGTSDVYPATGSPWVRTLTATYGGATVGTFTCQVNAGAWDGVYGWALPNPALIYDQGTLTPTSHPWDIQLQVSIPTVNSDRTKAHTVELMVGGQQTGYWSGGPISTGTRRR